MKKTLILALVALMMLGTAAFATNTRVLTMGEVNNVVLDEANIWLYPSRINMYPNIALGEVGYNDNYYSERSSYQVSQFGVHWKFNEKKPWVLGTYFYDAVQRGTDNLTYGNYGFIGLGFTTLPFRVWVPDFANDGWFDIPSTPTYNEENTRLSLFYGRKLGGMPFGFYFNRVHSSWKHEYPNDVDQRSLSENDLGFGLTDANGKWDVAIGLDLLSWKNTANYNPTAGGTVAHDVTKPKGNMNFHGQGRWFHTINPQWTIIPTAGFMFAKYEAEFWNWDQDNPDVNHTEKFNVTSFWAGVGTNYTPAANVLVVGEVGLGYTGEKYEGVYISPAQTWTDKYKYFTFPYFKVGIEGKVFDWMDVRFGANSYWQSETDEYSASPLPNPNYPGKDKYNFPDNRTFFGTGMHFGNFHIDTYTDPQIFLKGFNFVSGGQTVDLNWNVSVLYEFK